MFTSLDSELMEQVNKIWQINEIRFNLVSFTQMSMVWQSCGMVNL